MVILSDLLTEGISVCCLVLALSSRKMFECLCIAGIIIRVHRQASLTASDQWVLVFLAVKFIFVFSFSALLDQFL